MSKFPEGQVTSFDLNAEDHLEAEEIITGMQQCMLGLLDRKDSMLKQVSKAHTYGPLTTTITIDNNVVIIEKGAGELKIKLNGNPVLKLTGLNLDMIDYQGMKDALRGIRKYTILDDLANL
jgi:hypothetical protein